MLDLLHEKVIWESSDRQIVKYFDTEAMPIDCQEYCWLQIRFWRQSRYYKARSGISHSFDGKLYTRSFEMEAGLRL